MMKLYIPEDEKQKIGKTIDSFKDKMYEAGAVVPGKRFEEMKDQLNVQGDAELTLSDDCIQAAFRSILEREFLEFAEYDLELPKQKKMKRPNWLRLTRIPVSPLEDKKYAMYPRWQNAIAAAHMLGYQLCYVLKRSNKETSLLLGAIPIRGENSEEASVQLRQTVFAQMPGIELCNVDNHAIDDLYYYDYGAAVTGIPSIRKITEYGEYQTMDQIAMGLRDHDGKEHDFAIVILAEPIKDMQIVETMRILENIGSLIHSLTQTTKTTGINTGENISLTYSGGGSVGVSLGLAGRNEKVPVVPNLGINASAFLSTATSRSANIGNSSSVSAQYINKSAIYCEELIDKHLKRLKAGRSMGFWKTGVYVLASRSEDVSTVTSMLRAMYAGDDTYIEPIRTLIFPWNDRKLQFVKNLQIIPNKQEQIEQALGKVFEDYATPMTTEELSIATSLPHQDVAGLRLVRNASRFATNPPPLTENAKEYHLGDIMDYGASTDVPYIMDLNHLVKHTLVAGANGSGKTTSCMNMLKNLQKEKIPFLVIEPTKNEYLEWALEYNEKVSDEEKINIFAPGSFRKDVNELYFNVFQPAIMEGDSINMLGHVDRFKSAFINSMPMGEVLPLIIEEAIYQHVSDCMDVEEYSLVHKPNPLDGPYKDDPSIQYPRLEGLDETAERIISCREYDKEVERNLSAACKTRVKALLLGWKDGLFNAEKSIDYKTLFEKNTVINLSYLTDDKDKDLVMSILLIALWEYRESGDKMRPLSERKKDKLIHLTLVEEAHRLIPNMPGVLKEANAQATIGSMFTTMLSEVRAYGEGIVIVDQVPTRIIPDAIKNTNLKIVHRLISEDDIQAVASGMRLRKDQTMVIGGLQPGEAIVCSEYDDAAAWVKVKADGRE